MADQELLQAIDPYIQGENTGTAMVVFTDNSLVRIYLNSGIPTSARYKNKEGMKALELCKSMDIQTVRFHNDTDIVRSRKLLHSNHEVIESLSRSVTQNPDSIVSTPRVAGPLLSIANRQRLGNLLADYIGPVAPLVMSDVPASVDVEAALSIVSREIEDTQRAAEFVIAARALLE